MHSFREPALSWHALVGAYGRHSGTVTCSRVVMTVSVGIVAVLLAATGRHSVADEPLEPGWVRLFDGKTLAGWEGNLQFFRVERGAIVAGTLKNRIPHNEFLCTKREFEDFELRLEAKLIGQGRNAGVQFRSRRVPGSHEVEGYQCDIGEMNGQPIWGWLYDESRRRRFLQQADADRLRRVLKPNDWNALTIRCQGPRIRIWVNGYQTVDYMETDSKVPRSGIIGLQIHGGPPAEAWYRNIRIRPL